MRLIAFGCSLTLGAGLEDCYIDGRPGKNPSKFAWPAWLSKLTGRLLVNCAIAGASNKLICYNIQNFNFQNNDLVVVLWSHKDRFCTITENKVIDHNIWNGTKSSKAFIKHIHDDFDMTVDMHTRINYANYFLNNQGLKNFHAYADTNYAHNFTWHQVKMLKTNMAHIRGQYPRAMDNSHPGNEAHKFYAKQIYSEIKEII